MEETRHIVPAYLRKAEVAKFLSVSVRTLSQWCRRRLPLHSSPNNSLTQRRLTIRSSPSIRLASS